MAEEEEKRYLVAQGFFYPARMGRFRNFWWVDPPGLSQVGISTSAFSTPVDLQSRIANRLRYGRSQRKIQAGSARLDRSGRSRHLRHFRQMHPSGLHAALARCRE